MVKRKSEPKKGGAAGYAARTAEPVNDSTSISSVSSVSSVSSSSSSDERNKSPAKKKVLVKVAKKATFKPPVKAKTKVLADIRKLQAATKLLIPRAPFLRLVNNKLLFVLLKFFIVN